MVPQWIQDDRRAQLGHEENPSAMDIYDTTMTKVLISDVVHLSGTYLILLIRIRLYLCRLDYIYLSIVLTV